MGWRLIHGDALTVLPGLQPASVDLVLTDPPYNSGGRTQSDRTSTTARSFIGVEITGHYASVARERLENHAPCDEGLPVPRLPRP